MKLSIVYVSYRKDLVWLVYSLQLLFKHLKGDFEVIVRVDENCRDVVSQWGVPVRWVFLSHGWPDGYAHAMYQKMIADDYVSWDTDVIWLLDSDHMLMWEASVDEFFRDGKPLLPFIEWNDSDVSKMAKKKWGPPTQRCLGIELDKDYMIAPPMAYWKDTFRSVRQRVTQVTGQGFLDATYSGIPFKAENFVEHPMTICDYEMLGLYAAKFEPDRYALVHFHELGGDLGLAWPFEVYWSHGGCSEELQAKFKRLLSQ